MKDCPQQKQQVVGGKNWRHVPPDSSKGDPKVKIVDGKEYKWCEKCCKGKGLWTVRNSIHSTEEHRGRNTQATGSNEANLGVVNEPLSFGFLSTVGEGASWALKE